MPAAAAIGRDLGSRYHLCEVIGQGGCGVVWRAIEQETGEHVAVKVLRRELADAPGMLAQFMAEAEILRTVRHPHVLAIRDVVVEAGDIALVTDLIEGGTLRSMLDRAGPLTGSDATAVAAQLAAGLASVHAAGIVHADLKPQNVLLGTDGVRLADFGLARILGSTINGVRGGSRGYQAPEVLHGGEPTPSADIFAFGLVLYETWTGLLPRKRVPNARDRAKLTAAAAGEPAALAQTLLDALAADARRRPAARAIATRIAGIIEAEDRSVTGLSAQPAMPASRLPAAGHSDFGPLIEQYSGDSRPTVLDEGWQRPRPQSAGTATQYDRRQRRSRGRRALLTAAAVALAVVGAGLGYGGARNADASGAAEPYPVAWAAPEAYPAPTGWLCSTSGEHGTERSAFRLEVCVLADSRDRVVGRISAELISSVLGIRNKRVPVDLRIRLGAANGSAKLGEAGCALVLTTARPIGDCPPIKVTLHGPANVRAFGSVQLQSGVRSSQLVSTPAVAIQPRSVM
ncbi:MAG TPA: serine/threonine-protein kinase [Actinomycetes bacterium]|nr:serine/threonine-protein kinase [Actinomycetes bacterium]